MKPKLGRDGKMVSGLRGKVVSYAQVVSGEEEGTYCRVRFTDKTELVFRLVPRIVVEEVDLCDWKTDNMVQTRVYIQGPETKAVVAQDKLFNKIQAQLDKEARAKQRGRKHAT